MLKNIILSFCLCFYSLSILAQVIKSPDIVFGKVSIEDLSATKYSLDSNAVAVVLYEKGISYYDFNANGMKLVHEKHVRIKILSPNAANWTRFEIPTYKPKGNYQNRQQENVESLEGFTHILQDGKIIRHKLESQDVFTVDIDQNMQLTRFIMPLVEVGAVVEYRYKMTSDYLFNLQGWQFQKEIPVLWSEYEVKIPDYMSYVQFVQGYEDFTIESKNKVLDYFSFNGQIQTTNVMVYQWVMQNIPTFKVLPFMENPANNIARMDFVLESFLFPNMPKRQTIPSTWETIYEKLTKDEKIDNFAKKTGGLKEIVQKITATSIGETAIMQALFDYVKQNISYTGEKTRNPSQRNPEKVLESKKGNYADINLLLVALLKQAKIEANPLVLAGKETGNANPQYPILHRLNTIVAVAIADQTTYYLDATSKLHTTKMLPLRCLNGNGILLADSMQLIRLVPEVESRKIIQANLTIESTTIENTNTILGTMNVEESGYIAANSRQILENQSKEVFIQKSLTSEGEGIGMENLLTENDTIPYQNLKASVKITSQQQTEPSNKEFGFYPMLCLREQKNPFAEPKRKSPVDFVFPFIEDYRITYTIPATYSIKSLPTSADFALGNGEVTYRYIVSQKENQITIIHLLSVSSTKVAPKNYDGLQKFWDNIIQKHQEKIVLQKK
jgi:transglutaminase-like putative cysteine protease